jgi:23S rRNA (adenine-N6)-dimethyltransferase
MRKLSDSQNYFNNTQAIIELISKSGLGDSDIVIDIGAGKGSLTKELANKVKKVIAIENDEVNYRSLFVQLGANKKVTLINDNFLDYVLPQHYPYSIFSNIPFNYSSDVIRKLVNAVNPPSNMILFLQKEFADQLLGIPYSRESLKSIWLKTYYSPTLIYYCQKSDFLPPPKVDVVVVQMKKCVNLQSQRSIVQFLDFVAFAFSQTKPNIGKGFINLLTIKQQGYLTKNQEIDFSLKPSEITFTQWKKIYELVDKQVTSDKKKLFKGCYKKLQTQQQDLVKINRTREVVDWKLSND